MEYVKIVFGSCGYFPTKFSGDGMATLGGFFTTEVGRWVSSWVDWVLSDDDDEGMGNATHLEKEDGDIYLSFLYDESDEITRLKISPKNLLELLDYWHKNIVPSRPKYVAIIYENGVYTMKSSDSDDIV